MLRSARWAFECSTWRPTEADWQRAASGLEADEKRRTGRFVFRRDAKYSMAGRLMIRKFVAAATGLDWAAVRLTRDAYGKPVLDNALPEGASVQFNVSHQGDFAVLAGETGVDMVGVDVMKVEYKGRPVGEFLRSMRKILADEEWRMIESQTTDRNRLQCFYRYWCLKESYVKAVGVGLRMDVRTLAFKVNSPLVPATGAAVGLVRDTQLVVDGVQLDGWTFEEAMIGEDHCCSVALHVPAARVSAVTDDVQQFQRLSAHELLVGVQPVTAPDPEFVRQFFDKVEAP